MGSKGKQTVTERALVVCKNCRYHFTFDYEARAGQSNIERRVQDEKSFLDRAENPLVAYQRCPHCGLVQPWMIRLRRREWLKSYLKYGMLGGAFILAGVLLAGLYALTLPNAYVDEGFYLGLMQCGLAAYLTLGLAYLCYLNCLWNPNAKVDTSGYEAGPAVDVNRQELMESAIRYEAAARLVNRLESHSRERSTRRAYRTGMRALFAGSIALGLLTLLAPTLFPGSMNRLAQDGLMMAPFYVGVALIMVPMLGGSYKLLAKYVL